LIRLALEAAGAASVECAANFDEALDRLGGGSCQVTLTLLDTLTDGAACVRLLELFRLSEARIHVVLHGCYAPEEYATPDALTGAASYVHLATAGPAAAAAEAVIKAGATVRRILDTRIVPTTLDQGAALAIYGAEPGRPFPLSLRI
jgi:hypothetical protein